MQVRIVKVISPTLFWVHLGTLWRPIQGNARRFEYIHGAKKGQNAPDASLLQQNELVAIRTEKGWQLAIIVRFNEDNNVQLMLRDWGILKRNSKNELYRLEKQFYDHAWHAIPCGLAYAGPTTQGSQWSRKTKKLTKILTENREGWFKILEPVGLEGALVKISILRKMLAHRTY